MGRLSHYLETLGLHRRYGATRASRHSATKTVSVDNGNDQQHERRAVLGARQSVPPIRTDRQGRRALCRRGRGRERARTDESAQRRLCGVRSRGLGHGWRCFARARRGRRCELCRTLPSFAIMPGLAHVADRGLSVTFVFFRLLGR